MADRMDDKATIATLTRQLDAAKGALEWYANQFCEHGRYSECCGRMPDDDCSGCRARRALLPTSAEKPEAVEMGGLKAQVRSYADTQSVFETMPLPEAVETGEPVAWRGKPDDLIKRLRDEALELHRAAWARTDGGQGVTLSAMLAEEAADLIEALYAAPPAPTPPALLCPTCEGLGEVGGFVNADSGYQTDPCPTCAPATDDARARALEEQVVGLINAASGLIMELNPNGLSAKALDKWHAAFDEVVKAQKALALPQTAGDAT